MESKEEEDDHQRESCLEEPYNICFSGHNQGPKAYLRWERDMEEWFSSNKIKQEERTAIAEETLTDEAFLHWEIDAYLRLDYELPDRTWEEMKQLLHEEFVEKTETEPYIPRPLVPSEPRRWITVTPSMKVASPKTIKKKFTQSKPPPCHEPGTGNKAWALPTPHFTLDQHHHEGLYKEILIKSPITEVQRVREANKVKEKPPDPSTIEVDHFTPDKKVKEKPPDPATMEDKKIKENPPDPSTMKVDHFTPDKKVKDKPPDPSTMEDKKIKEKPPDPPPPHHAQGRTILRTKSSQEGGNDEDIEPTSPRS